MSSGYPGDFSREEEISTVIVSRAHAVLLGAGASRAALPDGDRHGRRVPLLRDVPTELELDEGAFPEELRELARTDFEAAYSRLVDLMPKAANEMEAVISEHFRTLELPEGPTIYDALVLSLRDKDAIFTFNWDPFLVQARV